MGMIIVPLLKYYGENRMGYVKNLAQTVAVVFQETYNLAVGKTHPWEHMRRALWRNRRLKHQPKGCTPWKLRVQGGRVQCEALLDKRKSRKNYKNEVTQWTGP